MYETIHSIVGAAAAEILKSSSVVIEPFGVQINSRREFNSIADSDIDTFPTKAERGIDRK